MAPTARRSAKTSSRRAAPDARPDARSATRGTGDDISELRPAAWVRALVLVGLCILAYANSLGNPFVLDDRVAVVENEAILDITDLRRVLVPRRESPVAGRPLVNASFALNHAVSGLDPVSFRVVNLAIHVACALLVMGAVRRTLVVATRVRVSETQAADFAWAVAALWAVHPLNSEVVNYITQRTEALMALCLFGTLYASARAHASARPLGWHALAVLACVLGMACKESMVVAPVLVLLCDAGLVYPSLREAWARRRGLYTCLGATWVALAALNWSGPRVRSAGFGTSVHPWTYLLNQAPIIVGYLMKAVWPRELVAVYGAPIPLTLGEVWLPVMLLAALAMASAAALWRGWWPGVVGAWVFVALSPASSVVPIITEVGAERRMYVPLLAMASLVVWGLWRLGQYSARPAIVTRAMIVAVVGAATVGTMARNAEYASALTLAQTNVERRPSGYASHMMAEALLAEGRKAEAVPLLQDAVGMSPRAQYALGVVYFNDGAYAEAFAQLDEFVRREPFLLEVVKSRVMMGKIHLQERRWVDAAEQFRQVLRMNPREPEAAELLAEALLSAEDYPAAIDAYRNHLAQEPSDVNARCNLALALIGAGRVEDAIETFRRNLELDPNHLVSIVNLAMALFDARQPDAALPLAERAVTLDGANPERHDFRGRVLAVQGRLGDAQQSFRRALELDPAYEPARENLAKLAQLARSLGPAQ